MPEIVCRGCGQVAHRVRTTFTSGAKPLRAPKEECEHCGDTAGKVTVPADQKLWLMADANPNEYEYRGGARVMKDWAQDEFQQRIGQQDPDEVAAIERAKARKRAHAREVRTVHGTQLSPEAIRRMDQQLKETVMEERAKAAGLVLV